MSICTSWLELLLLPSIKRLDKVVACITLECFHYIWKWVVVHFTSIREDCHLDGQMRKWNNRMSLRKHWLFPRTDQGSLRPFCKWCHITCDTLSSRNIRWNGNL